MPPPADGDGRQRGYSLSQKRIPPLEPPEKGLIGSLDLEGVQRLRSGSTCVAALLRSPPSALRYDLTCSYYPLPLCLSCFSADESPPTVSPIKAASKAKPPPSPASPAKRRRAQQCRRPQAVRRQTTVTRAPRSRARLIPLTTCRGSWRSHVHRTCTAQRVQPFKLQTANVGGRGERPSSFSGGYKGGILFEKRIPPLPGSSAKSCTDSCSAAGAATPIPREGDQKGYPLREENPPFFWQQRKELHELMQRQRRCTPHPPAREIKGDTLFEKRRNPCNIKVSQ